jgi:hypothetical protein
VIRAFRFSPTVPEGNDAFDIAPGGNVLFSLNETSFSETLGAIQHGDLLSERGDRILLSQQLVEEFGLFFDALDLGLDALVAREEGEIYFSLTMEIESPKAGPLHPGDLLSNRGVIVRRFSDLLARFHPPRRDHDYGLDALFLWPSDEIWFSTEEGFQDNELGPVQHGDLLSDQGYIVIRNLDLLGPFQPLEDLADFGLDGLFIVTDVGPAAAPPKLAVPILNNSGVTLEWEAKGKVFQVIRGASATGPWSEVSPIIPGVQFTDPTVPDRPMGVYRLKQW